MCCKMSLAFCALLIMLVKWVRNSAFCVFYGLAILLYTTHTRLLTVWNKTVYAENVIFFFHKQLCVFGQPKKAYLTKYAKQNEILKNQSGFTLEIIKLICIFFFSFSILGLLTKWKKTGLEFWTSLRSLLANFCLAFLST